MSDTLWCFCKRKEKSKKVKKLQICYRSLPSWQNVFFWPFGEEGLEKYVSHNYNYNMSFQDHLNVTVFAEDES